MKSKDIVKIENIENLNNKAYIIRWQMTSLCNYKCDFCIQGNRQEHINKSKGESKELRNIICEKIVKYIENELNEKYDYIKIYLIGGEVTILPEFIELLSKIVNCKFNGNIKINLTTNLSTNIAVLNKIVEIFKNTKLKRIISINASYYNEFTNETEFINKVKLLKQRDRKIITKIRYNVYKIKKYILKSKTKFINKKIRINIGYPLCNDEDYDKFILFKNKYKKYADDIDYIIIKNYKTSISNQLKNKILKENKQKKQIKVIFNNGEEYYFLNNNKIALKLDDEDKFNPKGYLCDSGIKSLLIDNKGNMFRCISCKDKTIFGNIVNDDIKLPTKEFVCPSENCGCSYYTLIKKNK